MVIKVAVIGAGAAGLACARRLKENPEFSFVVYEQAGEVGGTWIYDERTGCDEYGIPIHTSMYRSLRTNLPKEVMGYPGFPITKPADKSYIPSADILAFLNDFTEAFDLRKHIKFRHWVKVVKPVKNKWLVETSDVVNKRMNSELFDAVMVCNGHYEVANIPKIKGQDVFQGKQIHSHDYRVPEAFTGQTVVIIGAGPSGLDIGLDVSSHAKTVFLSHHLPDKIDTPFPPNFYFKPDIKEIQENGVSFMDGTYADVNCVFYCTGYKYCFPFLSEDCGIRISDNYVHPLYKHLISIDNPTLCFVGLPFYVCAFSMFDLQQTKSALVTKKAGTDAYTETETISTKSILVLCENAESTLISKFSQASWPIQTSRAPCKGQGYCSRTDNNKKVLSCSSCPRNLGEYMTENHLARFFINTLTGKCILPSKEAMQQDEQAEMKKRKEMKFHSRDSHKMGPLQMDYYDDLAKTGKIVGLPHVLTKLHNESSRRFLEDLRNFRNDKYRLIDDETFEEIV